MERRHCLRAVRNLAAAALLLTVFWWLCSCPLPTVEMRLRCGERQYLVGESDIVFSYKSGMKGDVKNPVMLVSVGERTVQTYSDYAYIDLHHFDIWPKNPKGATLVHLPTELEDLTAGVVAVEPPALTERAVLTMHLKCDGEEAVVTAEGGEQIDEVFLFRLEAREDVSYGMLRTLIDTTALPPYTLEFFGGDGTLLETVTNMT